VTGHRNGMRVSASTCLGDCIYSRWIKGAISLIDLPAKWVTGRYFPAHLCDGSDQNGGNRYGALSAERPAKASHPSRAALIKLLKRRRGAARTDRSAMWVLLDYLLST
jgi:hypothetical protein